MDKIEFNIKRRLLTKEEKLRRAIFFFAYALPDFNIEYVNGEYEEDEYNQVLVDIDKNINKFDDMTKVKIYEFAEKEIYDETINLKCLKCDYEELNENRNEIDECWNKIDYPRMYCPKCDKPQFVPLDVWKKKNKYKK